MTPGRGASSSGDPTVEPPPGPPCSPGEAPGVGSRTPTPAPPTPLLWDLCVPRASPRGGQTPQGCWGWAPEGRQEPQSQVCSQDGPWGEPPAFCGAGWGSGRGTAWWGTVWAFHWPPWHPTGASYPEQHRSPRGHRDLPGPCPSAPACMTSTHVPAEKAEANPPSSSAAKRGPARPALQAPEVKGSCDQLQGLDGGRGWSRAAFPFVPPRPGLELFTAWDCLLGLEGRAPAAGHPRPFNQPSIPAAASPAAPRASSRGFQAPWSRRGLPSSHLGPLPSPPGHQGRPEPDALELLALPEGPLPMYPQDTHPAPQAA